MSTVNVNVPPHSVTPPAFTEPGYQAPITAPDGGAIDAAYKAAGWTPPSPTPIPPPTVLNDVKRWNYTVAVGTNNPHEHHPHGMPSNWSWYANGENPNPTPPAVQCLTGWGQIYLADVGTWVNGIQFDIDGMQSWLVSKSGVFTPAQAPGPFGGTSPAEDWSSGASLTITQKSAITYTISFPQGHLGHFWPNPRFQLPSGFSGYCASTYRVRMVLPSGYSGPAPVYIANAGCDWWATMNSGPNPEAAQARFCTIPTDGSWMAVNSFSGSASVQLTNVPSTW